MFVDYTGIQCENARLYNSFTNVEFFVATCCAVMEPQTLRTRFRSKRSLGIIAGAKGEGSPFVCNAKQVAFIQNALKLVNYYGKSSSNFLLKDDAENTAAFIGWFGCKTL